MFSDNFAENLMRTGDASVQLITDGTEPNQASMITGYASNILASYQQSLSEQGQIPFRIEPEIKMLFNPQSESAYNFVPGVMGMILMLICAMMTSIAIVREKETGTDGGIACIADEAYLYYLGESRSLFCPVYSQPDNDTFVIGVCSRCSSSGKYIFAHVHIVGVYLFGFVAGVTHFYSCRYANGGYTGFGYGPDDAYDDIVGAGISNREYAGCFTMDLGDSAGEVVYRGDKENHDTRCRN